jgi:hypothetical protein
MKIYQEVPKLLVGDTDTHTYRQTGDFISLLSFLESRLKRLELKSNFYSLETGQLKSKS